jgi:hypothetical protein
MHAANGFSTETAQVIIQPDGVGPDCHAWHPFVNVGSKSAASGPSRLNRTLKPASRDGDRRLCADLGARKPLLRRGDARTAKYLLHP